MLLGAALGCGHTSAAQPEPENPPRRKAVVPAPKPPPSASIGDAMGDHFAITSFARDAVIAGLLEPLRAPLRALADYHYEDVRSGGWMPWIAQLQSAARLTSDAATLDVAAMGVASMARVCGECHVATHGGPVLPPPPAAEEQRLAADTVSERMARHMLSAELLWEGLTAPSDAVWNAGAKALIDAPDQLDDALPESFDADLRQVQALGKDASDATTLAQRADVFGLLIATCSECHTRWIDHGMD
ncbi:MAG TPA: hypothetical protein VJR89_10350 [Polyangiales bacterium]|nr:hypothetical protein [Polyangiales bacterium]